MNTTVPVDGAIAEKESKMAAMMSCYKDDDCSGFVWNMNEKKGYLLSGQIGQQTSAQGVTFFEKKADVN